MHLTPLDHHAVKSSVVKQGNPYESAKDGIILDVIVSPLHLGQKEIEKETGFAVMKYVYLPSV